MVTIQSKVFIIHGSIPCKNIFFYLQGFEPWKEDGETDGWSQKSSRLCLR